MFPFFFETFGVIGLVGFGFWVWMLSDCLRSGGRGQWIWVMITLNVIGAFLYFYICWLPRHPNFLPAPIFLNRWRLKDALWQAEADAHNIGNALQYVKLGDILRQMGELDRSAIAYQQLEEINEAKQALETMIIKVKSSTPFQYRKNRKFVDQGKRMLKNLS